MFGSGLSTVARAVAESVGAPANPGRMDPLRIITATEGFFTRREAKNAGYADREITRIVRDGAWHRIRRGAYVFADEWKALDAVGRHRVRARAVQRSLGSKIALSHVSGLVAHGIDLWGVDLARVHVTRLDGAGRPLEGDVVHHLGVVRDDEIETRDGLRTLPAVRCALEACLQASDEVAQCLLDAGLRAEAFTKEELEAEYERMDQWPFSHPLGAAVAHADSRSGSIGESRCLWLFRAGGLPRPELQVPVHRADGSLVGIVDWAWPQFRLFGEFDGRVKYGKHLRPGQTPGDAVFAEKRREDEIREITDYGFVRVTWVDLDNPRQMLARVDSRMRSAG